MSHRYSTALSHLVLAGTGIYCLIKIKGQPLNFPHVTYGVITLNSVLGLWRWGNPDYGEGIDRVYRFTSFLQKIFALPCITTTVWLANGYMKELSIAHTAVSLIPLICYLANSYSDRELVQLILAVNCISLGIVSYMHENFYGIAAAISYTIAEFFLRSEGYFQDDVPAQDLYNYGLCFFAFFALRAIGSGGEI